MDQQHLQAAGANYPYPHQNGLYAIPSGVFLLVMGLSTLDQPPAPAVLMVAFAVVLGLFGIVYLYYARTLGIVTPAPARRRQYNIAAGAAIGTLLVLDLIGSSLLGPHGVEMLLAAWAISFLVFQALTVRVRLYDLVIAAGLLIIAVLPIWTTDPNRSALAFLPIAAAVMLTGLIEHVRLTRWYRNYPGPGTSDLENHGRA